jgi:hypothetical protein
MFIMPDWLLVMNRAPDTAVLAAPLSEAVAVSV